MYLLFRHKNMLPSDYHKLPIGEKQILSVFLKLEIEERQKEVASMFGKG